MLARDDDLAALVVAASPRVTPLAAAAQNCPTMRKINVGVSVAPPNVVHTAPYVAKALGFFAKHCIDANIIQFDGGAAGTSVTAVAQGTAISNLPRCRDRARPEGQADLGPRTAPAAGLRGGGRASRPRPISRASGSARRRRRRRLQLADGPRSAARRRASPSTTRSSSRRAPRAACPASSPDRSTACAASGGRLSGAAEEARRACADQLVGPAAALRVQAYGAVDATDRQGPRRCCATPSRR